jgi:hypothetical protein
MILITDIKVVVDITTGKSKIQMHKADLHQEGLKLFVSEVGWIDVPAEFVDAPNLTNDQEYELNKQRHNLHPEEG